MGLVTLLAWWGMQCNNCILQTKLSCVLHYGNLKPPEWFYLVFTFSYAWKHGWFNIVSVESSSQISSNVEVALKTISGANFLFSKIALTFKHKSYVGLQSHGF